MADNKTLPATGTGTADIRVATRTVTYSGDVAEAAWLTDQNFANFEIGIRLAASAGLLALLDKGQIAYRAARTK